MTALIQQLPECDRHWLHQTALGIYLDGECYAFAIALHRGLGWPIYGIMENDVIRHAVVRTPHGAWHDVRGAVPDEELCSPFGLSPETPKKLIGVGDLYATRPIREQSIGIASKWAERIWPELPWLTSFDEKAKAFAEELEALSRKHKLWIRACTPASPPMLALGENDESGYTLTPTIDGLGFSIDRRL